MLGSVNLQDSKQLVVSPYRFEISRENQAQVGELNEKLAEYENRLRRLCEDRAHFFVGFFEPLVEPRYLDDDQPIIRDRLTADGTRLSEYGHWRTALSLCEKLGVTLDTLTIRLDTVADEFEIKNGVLLASEKASSDASTSKIYTWTVQLKYAPLPPPPESSPRGGRMMARHDRVTIKGLPAGKYGLQINGHPTVVADETGWSRGVYFLLGESTPHTDQLSETLASRQELLKSFVSLSRSENPELHSSLAAELETCESELKRLLQPQTVRFTLERVE